MRAYELIVEGVVRRRAVREAQANVDACAEHERHAGRQLDRAKADEQLAQRGYRDWCEALQAALDAEDEPVKR
jgi:hypothetical protein